MLALTKGKYGGGGGGIKKIEQKGKQAIGTLGALTSTLTRFLKKVSTGG